MCSFDTAFAFSRVASQSVVEVVSEYRVSCSCQYFTAVKADAHLRWSLSASPTLSFVRERR